MTETTHTPGPWLVEQNVVYALGSHGFNRFSAGVYGGEAENGERVSTTEVAANARLIAAAPDLLAALEGMIGQYVAFVVQGAAMIHHEGDRSEYMAQHREIEHAAHAAIAAARGGTK